MGLFLFFSSPDTIDQNMETTTVSDSSLSNNGKTGTPIVWNFNDLTGWEDATKLGFKITG
jgi:hypothetical protein